LAALGACFILNDTFGILVYLFGRKDKNQKSRKKKEQIKLKPVYLPNGGTKY